VFDALPGWVTALLKPIGLADFDAVQRHLNTRLEQASGFIAARVISLGQSTFEFSASLLITPYLAFFLILDGERIAHAMRRALPLTPEHQQELLRKFSNVIRSTVKGNLVVAGTQGALGGLAFWFLEVRGALLWAVVMAFLSLLPAFGAALVWLPVAIWFLITGATWQGVALLAWGVLVIGLVDNLLRPLLISGRAEVPTLAVFIGVIGGLAAFGFIGLFVGPIVLGLLMALFRFELDRRKVEDGDA
jgi:predicted PurR-regulated permease PerM